MTLPAHQVLENPKKKHAVGHQSFNKDIDWEWVHATIIIIIIIIIFNMFGQEGGGGFELITSASLDVVSANCAISWGHLH